MLGKGIRKINMKTQLLFNGWWAHYHPDCWFKDSEDTQYLEKGVLVLKLTAGRIHTFKKYINPGGVSLT